MRHQTPYEKGLRLRWYRLVEAEHRPVEDVCRTFGIPKKTYYKWYARDHGLGSSDHRSRKPDAKTKLTPDLVAWIVERKRKTNYGPLKMKLEVARVWRSREEWLEYYNTERIHLSLGGITPREKAAQYLSTVTP